MSCPFSTLAKYNKEWKGERFPKIVLEKTLKDLEAVLKKNNRKTVKYVRKFDMAYDNPLRFSYWPRLLNLRNPDVIVPSTPYRESSEAPNTSRFDTLLDMSGYKWADKSLLKTWHLTEDGIKTVRYILHSLSEDNTTIVYCPELWNLCALFVHYHDQNVIMSSLKAILKEQTWVAQTKDEWKAKVLSLAFYILPKNAHHPQIVPIFEKWIQAVWDLPFEILILIIDSYLLEGYKVFYRAAIVLCADSRGKFSGDIKLEEMAKNVTRDPQDFRDAMFSIKRMSRKKIVAAMQKATHFIKNSKFSFDKYVDPCVADGKLTRSAILEEDAKKAAAVTPAAIVQGAIVADEKKADSASASPTQVITPYSAMISNQEMSDIVINIDDENIAKVCKPKLVYSSETDGVSMTTLLGKAPEKESLLLLEVDTKPEKAVIGAFLYDKLEKKEGFYGRGKTFVFRMKPGKLETFKWKEAEKKEDQTMYKFQRVTNDCIEIGAGKESHSAAIHLNENLSKVKSGPSVIFDSPTLFHGLGEEGKKHADDETVEATILKAELFTFVELS